MTTDTFTLSQIALHLEVAEESILAFEVWEKAILVKVKGEKAILIPYEQLFSRVNRTPETQEEIKLEVTKRELRVIANLLTLANLDKPGIINPRTIAKIKAILTKESMTIEDYYALQTIAEVFASKDSHAAALFSAMSPLPKRTNVVGHCHIDSRDHGKDDHYWQSLTNEG